MKVFKENKMIDKHFLHYMQEPGSCEEDFTYSIEMFGPTYTRKTNMEDIRIRLEKYAKELKKGIID